MSRNLSLRVSQRLADANFGLGNARRAALLGLLRRVSLEFPLGIYSRPTSTPGSRPLAP